ncbi:hypothetical protein H696_05234 [Fonticula alba]|uniref:NADH dehydrogenase [ubiquinone] 1 beta subcomplex subunit 4 n=1 Tax=Fonticula alba TaxID=691883 RepID=A0A058Z2F3_FONAL|nr:hypothetical protein H696_05234 [Fonticula alba]KCV68316.1 hypothetical protein H696_05234 [Fonticula alba]|eukprot:XP_009497370.1 hypothetical protein H696_05234 [Fonticula alba]
MQNPFSATPIMRDPAIESWASMRENQFRYFRITPRNAVIMAVAGVILPYTLYHVIVNDMEAAQDRKRIPLRPMLYSSRLDQPAAPVAEE